jgi:NADPH:quinone reductase-like Zn-dependent oxidoreductase
MKAFAIDEYRGELTLRELAEPTAGPGEVVVEISAAGVNPLDARIRDGDFRRFLRYDMPLVLGSDLAGRIASAGPGVTRFRKGDEVFAKVDVARIGTFAERVSISEKDVARKPANVSMTEAASLPLVALTAWQALVERAGVKRGQKVLIHAGAGGVGTVAIQLAKHLGATVATTASASSFDLLRALGADDVIDYRSDDFARDLRDYDVVLTSLDRDVLEKSLKVLRPGGHLVSLSGPPDPAFATQIGAGWAMRQIMRVLSFRARRLARWQGVNYSFLFVRADGEQLAKIAKLVDTGAIRPVVDQVLPFERTPEILSLLAGRRGPGKLVVSREDASSGSGGRTVEELLGQLRAVRPVERADRN